MQTQFISGDYMLQGVHDMVAGFRFTPDGKYQFTYIYGVVDRMSEGTYTMSGNTITLLSAKSPGQDFKIERQEKKGKGVTIHVMDPNPYLASYATAIYGTSFPYERVGADQEGRIVLPDGIDHDIYLTHELYPDVPTLIKAKDNPNTHFEVSLLPSLGQVTFKGVEFRLEDDTLTCLPNSLLPFENIRFVKAE